MQRYLITRTLKQGNAHTERAALSATKPGSCHDCAMQHDERFQLLFAPTFRREDHPMQERRLATWPKATVVDAAVRELRKMASERSTLMRDLPAIGTELSDEEGWRQVTAHEADGYWVMDRYGNERFVTTEPPRCLTCGCRGRPSGGCLEHPCRCHHTEEICP